MWIDKKIIPILIDAVRETVEMEMEDYENEAYEGHLDPNDWIIFESFVLPVLESHRDVGFDSEDMLDKGFGFLMGLVPCCLKGETKELDPEIYGMLAKAHFEYSLRMIHRYVSGIPHDYVRENLAGINEKLDAIKLQTAVGKGDGWE